MTIVMGRWNGQRFLAVLIKSWRNCEGKVSERMPGRFFMVFLMILPHQA